MHICRKVFFLFFNAFILFKELLTKQFYDSQIQVDIKWLRGRPVILKNVHQVHGVCVCFFFLGHCFGAGGDCPHDG